MPPLRTATRLSGLGLALLALLPLLVFSGFAVTEVIRTSRANEEARLQDTATLAAAAVDARLGAYVAAMSTLALSPSLLPSLPPSPPPSRAREHDHAGFHQRAQSVGALLGGEILLLGPPPEFELQATSALPQEAPPSVDGDGLHRRVLEQAGAEAAATRRPVVSNLSFNPAGIPSVVVVTPVLRGGDLIFLLVFRFNPEDLLPAINAVGGVRGSFAGVTDGRGRIAFNTRGAAGPPSGTPMPLAVANGIEGLQRGITIAPRVDGSTTTFAFERLAQAPGWVVFVGRTFEAQAAANTRLIAWAFAAVVALAAGLGQLLAAHRREALRLARQEAAALRAGRAEIERLLGGLPAVIFLRAVRADGSARVIYRDGDIEAVTGWPSALLRELDDWSAYCSPAWSSAAFLRAAIAEPSTVTEWQMRQPDGSYRSMRTYTRRLSARPDGSFELVGYLLNVDAELKASARAAAAGRLASLGEMATGIAHELKQPLQSVSLLAENALRTTERGATDRVAERLHRIVEQIGHAADIIENLRRFARGTPEGAASAPVDLSRVTRQTLVLTEAALREASVAVEVELGTPAPMVMGHALGIEQTLLNLVLNARDAMTQQPPERPRRIRIWTEAAGGGQLALKISDTGGGIPPEVMARIFEPFVTTKAPDKGTGLGLSISHGLIQAMGGRIEAANGAEGAVFTILLPATGGA